MKKLTPVADEIAQRLMTSAGVTTKVARASQTETALKRVFNMGIGWLAQKLESLKNAPTQKKPVSPRVRSIS